MKLINFMSRFAALVMAGEKFQTIRAMRVEPFVAGDRLRLFYGLRTDRAVPIYDAIVVAIKPFRFLTAREGADMIYVVEFGNRMGGRADIKSGWMIDLAHADGFRSVEEFLAFFSEQAKKNGGTFVGQVVYWRPMTVRDSDPLPKHARRKLAPWLKR